MLPTVAMLTNQKCRQFARLLPLTLLASLAACMPPGPRALLQGERLIKEGKFKYVLQFGQTEAPHLKGIPAVYQYAKTDADRQAFDLVFGVQSIGRPYATPPGTLPEPPSTTIAMNMTDRFSGKLSGEMKPIFVA